jgi:IS5 family transposase
MAMMRPGVEWHIARRRKPIREMAEGWQKSLILAQEKLKVEHAFHVLKNIFRYQKARYKGLHKNDAQLRMLFALGNLYMVRAKLSA